LYADEIVVLKYGETMAIKTNIAIELPEGYVADVRPRSGLTLNTGLRVHYGTIDAGYRDGIGIIVENCAVNPYVSTKINIKRGQKIAQLVILPIPTIELQEVTELSDSDRGLKGFGSTGV